MGILTSDQGVFVGLSEATYGADAVDVVIQALGALQYSGVDSDVSITREDAEFRPNRLRPSQDGVASVMVPDHNAWSLKHGLRGGAGSDFTPTYGWLLKACGLAETVSAGVSTTYALGTSIAASATMYHYKRDFGANSRLVYCTGALGNCSFSGSVREEVVVSASGMAASANDLAVARANISATTGRVLLDKAGAAKSLSAPVFDASEILIAKSVTLTVGGTAYPCSAFTLDMGMGVSALETMQSAQAATRIVRSRGDGANASGSLALEMSDDDAALDDVLTKWVASTEAALSIVVAGTRTITFTLPKIQLKRPAPRDSGGAQGWDVAFSVNGDFGTLPTADNGIKLVYT